MYESIVERFDAVARRAPASPALRWRAAQWTYQDLQGAVGVARGALAGRQLPRGARIALLLRNSPQYVALYYGALGCGYVAVPLNPQERARVLARQIEHCGASLLVGDVTHPEWSALLREIEPLRTEVLAVTLHDDSSSAASFADDIGAKANHAAVSKLDASAIATIIYTSGTTGRPKGVTLSHGNLDANTAAIIQYLGISDADRGLCVLPFHFSYGNSVLHTHLLSGAQLSLEENFAFPQVALRRMQDEAITGFAGVPSTFALLLGRCDLRDFDLRHLRYVTQAGGAMPRALIERLREQLPATQIFVMYGQTEATARLSYLPPAELATRMGSVGIPVADVDIEVRQEGRVAPRGVVGDIYARGPNVMQGYWNDPSATAEVLSNGWLRTGDLGHRDEDGFLYIDGRAVDMIKAGAFRVSPQEIEEVIAAFAGVQEVAVVGIPDALLGQAIKAVVVPNPGAALDIRAIKAHCLRELAAYKVPKVVELAPALPRTSSGKVQRFKLVSGREIVS